MDTDQKERIMNLKREIDAVVGQPYIFEAPPDFPPDLEEAFLERVLWFEKESKRALRERLAQADIVMEDPCRLPDEDLSRRLWEVIHALITLRISPANTDHLSDRELYTCLWEIVSSGVPSHDVIAAHRGRDVVQRPALVARTTSP